MEDLISKIKNHPCLLQIGVKIETGMNDEFTDRFENKNQLMSFVQKAEADNYEEYRNQ